MGTYTIITDSAYQDLEKNGWLSFEIIKYEIFPPLCNPFWDHGVDPCNHVMVKHGNEVYN